MAKQYQNNEQTLCIGWTCHFQYQHQKNFWSATEYLGPSGFLRVHNGLHCFLLLFHKQRDQSRAIVLCPLYKLLVMFRVLHNEFYCACYYWMEEILHHMQQDFPTYGGRWIWQILHTVKVWFILTVVARTGIQNHCRKIDLVHNL
jgi:hypothetical protein